MRRILSGLIGIMILLAASCGGSEPVDVAAQIDEPTATAAPTTAMPVTEPSATSPPTTEATIIVTATTAVGDTATEDTATAEADTDSAPPEITPVVASEIDFENSDVVLWFWAPW